MATNKKTILADINKMKKEIDKRIRETRSDKAAGGSVKRLESEIEIFNKLTGKKKTDKLYIGGIEKWSEPRLKSFASKQKAFLKSPHFTKEGRRSIEAKTLETMKATGRANTINEVRKIRNAFKYFEDKTGMFADAMDRNLLSSDQIVEIATSSTINKLDKALINIEDPATGLELNQGQFTPGSMRYILETVMEHPSMPPVAAVHKYASQYYTLTENEEARSNLWKNYHENKMTKEKYLEELGKLTNR